MQLLLAMKSDVALQIPPDIEKRALERFDDLVKRGALKFDDVEPEVVEDHGLKVLSCHLLLFKSPMFIESHTDAESFQNSNSSNFESLPSSKPSLFSRRMIQVERRPAAPS